jgi:hypothetical protein
MSTREVSSIKPKMDCKAPTYDEGIKLKYSTAAYDSFIKEGFIPPEPQYRHIVYFISSTTSFT